MSTVVAVKTAKKPSLGDKVSQLYKAIKKAFTPEAEYPHTPGNVEVEATSDLIADIHAMGFKDYETLLAFLNAAVTGTINDNDLLLENLIRLLAKLPQTSKAGKQLTDGLLTQLWGTLDHPPYTSTGFEYRYRAADGSGNNIHQPLLGAANTPYARTVSPMTFQSPNPPDPDVIFDSLMARGDTFTPHPQGISSMLFYLATIIIHDIFQTVRLDGCTHFEIGRLMRDMQGAWELRYQSDIVLSGPFTTVRSKPRGAKRHEDTQGWPA